MNRAELASEIARETGLSEVDAENAIRAFVDVVAQELKRGGKVQLTGFGTFEVSTRAAHEGINPYTGEMMEIQESKTPKFKAGKTLKDIVKNKR